MTRWENLPLIFFIALMVVGSIVVRHLIRGRALLSDSPLDWTAAVVAFIIAFAIIATSDAFP